MIVVDTSALMAILNREADASLYAAAISDADRPLLSAASFVETSIVMLNRHGPKSSRLVDALIHESGIQIENVTTQHALLAREAYAIYGKGQRSAGLNFGDCFSYALAKATGFPLLFKGEDFKKTDVVPAL